MITQQHVVLSPGVRAMLGLRMDITKGEPPSVWQKFMVEIGQGARIGLTPEQIASVKAGLARDLSKGESDLISLVEPILHQDAAAVEASLATWALGFFGKLQGETSIAQAAADAKAALKTEGGALLSLVESMAEAAWQAFVGLVLAKLGKVVPAA